MKVLNWIACITFGLIAVLAVIVFLFSAKKEYIGIAFVCGFVSVASYSDLKNP